MPSFDSLPPEITREVLRYLPIKSLLSFGLTSKRNHVFQTSSLSNLRLGVFHSRLGGMVSLMEATADRSCLHSVQMILSKHDSRTKSKVVYNQNISIQRVIDAYQHTLRNLEIALWELHDSSATSIAQLNNLKRLSIRLDHPHTRYPGLDLRYWDTSLGSTVWNLLASRPGEPRILGRLQTLNLERAGITDYQLAKILQGNPALTDLRLRKCFTLTDKTFKLLAESRIGQRLDTLHFTNSDTDEIDERILHYIGKLPKLKSLSLHGCVNIDGDLVKKMNNEQWRISDLTLPSPPSSPREGVEVDDEYK